MSPWTLLAFVAVVAVVVGLWWWLLIVPLLERLGRATQAKIQSPDGPRTELPPATEDFLPYTHRELATDGHPIDRFFDRSDVVEWIAVRTDREAVTAAWAELTSATSRRRDVAEQRVAREDDGNHWAVYRYSGSPWTHIQFSRGVSSLSDRHLRDLSTRLAADVLLVYGRNDYDKARALAVVRYANGQPEAALLIGTDDDQDLLLDHLGLDQDEIGALDFDFEFDAGRALSVELLAKHGLEAGDITGELERMDLLIE